MLDSTQKCWIVLDRALLCLIVIKSILYSIDILNGFIVYDGLIESKKNIRREKISSIWHQTLLFCDFWHHSFVIWRRKWQTFFKRHSFLPIINRKACTSHLSGGSTVRFKAPSVEYRNRETKKKKLHNHGWCQKSSEIACPRHF